MTKELSRRDLMSRAGLALGGAMTLGALACSGGEDSPTPPATTTEPAVSDFPYAKHLAADFRLDVAAIQEAAYQAYYNGGCCHGAYSALLGDLQQRAGAPFDKLPIDFGKFGAGGIALYGSICGSVLGGVLITNMIVQNPTEAVPPATAPQDVRNAMITELMRWYETFSFPAYVPKQANAKEHQNADPAAALVTTIGFATAPATENDAAVRLVPGSHLCHASVTGWCTAMQVSAKGADKLARCARLTADVAGKTAELINAYLASDRKSFQGTAPNGAAACTGCHTPASVAATVTDPPPVASGMACASCHPTQVTAHP